MDVLQDELAKLHRDANLTQSIRDVDKIIEQLERARESIVAGKRSSVLHVQTGGICSTFYEIRRLDCRRFEDTLSLTFIQIQVQPP